MPMDNLRSFNGSKTPKGQPVAGQNPTPSHQQPKITPPPAPTSPKQTSPTPTPTPTPDPVASRAARPNPRPQPAIPLRPPAAQVPSSLNASTVPPERAIVRAIPNPLAPIAKMFIGLATRPNPAQHRDQPNVNTNNPPKRKPRHVHGAGTGIHYDNIAQAVGATFPLLTGLALFVTGAAAFTLWFASLKLLGSDVFSGSLGFSLYLVISFFELYQSPFEHGWNDDPTTSLFWLFVILVDVGCIFGGVFAWIVGKEIPLGSLKIVFKGDQLPTAPIALILATIIALGAEKFIKAGLKRLLKAFYIYPTWLETR